MPRVQPICAQVLADRYAAPGERDALRIYARVAAALALAEPPALQADRARQFLANMQAGAIGAGRIMANAGTDTCATMVNCFVQPVGGGPGALSFEAGLEQACATLAMGGGVGYDFSALAPVAAAGGTAAPAVCDAIDRYDSACASLQFQGSRRGAQMAVLSCSHPDVLAFARAKHGRRRWRTFNVSVAVTDAFLAAVQRDEPWPLVHPAPPGPQAIAAGALLRDDGQWQYGLAPARSLWDAIVQESVHSAEPGLLYIDTINRRNNLRALETLRATNPCGEQPLPDYGCCVLGPIDLTRLVMHPFGLGGRAELDMEKLAGLVRTQVRMLDNVIDLTRWPLPAQRAEAMSKRRVGVGVTGLADMLTMLQLRYDSESGRQVASAVARCLRDSAYAASAALAAERKPFPLYRPRDYLTAGAIGDALPVRVRAAIRQHGLRNSHLVSYAPTGSVSLAFADNCSNGIEPPYGWAYRRRVTLRGTPVDMTVENHAWRLWRSLHPHAPLPAGFRTAAQIAPEDHVAMLGALQPFVDAAISKTVPVPTDCSVERAQALFMSAWRLGLKGLTLFRPEPGLDAVLGDAETGTPAPCEVCL
ncbi:ribonucleoside-diphosphate reductase class II [Achromobacter sp. MFA1 R4]|nr:ribonucleoside-diphosphate reductase class II [Achromobacter sp. MFA1 R4]